MTRHFPVRPKTAFPKAVSGEAMPPKVRHNLGGTHNKIIPFPNHYRGGTKTYPAILNFPVRKIENCPPPDTSNPSRYPG